MAILGSRQFQRIAAVSPLFPVLLHARLFSTLRCAPLDASSSRVLRLAGVLDARALPRRTFRYYRHPSQRTRRKSLPMAHRSRTTTPRSSSSSLPFLALVFPRYLYPEPFRRVLISSSGETFGQRFFRWFFSAAPLDETVHRFVISPPRLKSFTRPTVKPDTPRIIRCLSCFHEEYRILTLAGKDSETPRRLIAG